VILSAPARGDEMPTVVHGVSAPDGSTPIISCASCTTNCIAPAVEVMGRRIGIKKAAMTTVHAYTSTQGLVDGPKNDFRRGRAGAANLVPTSTGAALATTRALPQYAGRFDGLAVRAPVSVGSLADHVFVTARPTSVEEINAVFRRRPPASGTRACWASPRSPSSRRTSSETRASVIDLGMTQVIDGDLVKVLSWYDNEWGYSSQMIRQAIRTIL
jgi:glyceraldehyde 3-phosphate dehydrogenase (phosphorylating)